jgi:hypothetical protein
MKILTKFIARIFQSRRREAINFRKENLMLYCDFRLINSTRIHYRVDVLRFLKNPNCCALLCAESLTRCFDERNDFLKKIHSPISVNFFDDTCIVDYIDNKKIRFNIVKYNGEYDYKLNSTIIREIERRRMTL